MRDSPYFRFFSALIVIATSVAVSIRADDIFIWAQETISGVTINYEGSIDLTDFPTSDPSKGGKAQGIIEPSSGRIRKYGEAVKEYQVLPSNGRSFGTGSGIFATDSSGDEFGLTDEADDYLELADDYASHEPISGSIEFAGETLTSLGIDTTPFAFKTTVGNNTIRMFTSPSEYAAQLTEEAAAIATAKVDLLKKIQKLKKKAKKLKKKGKKAKAKKLGKKAKKLKAQLLALG